MTSLLSVRMGEGIYWPTSSNIKHFVPRRKILSLYVCSVFGNREDGLLLEKTKKGDSYDNLKDSKQI